MLNCQNGIAFWRILTLRPLPLTAVCAFPAIVEKITKHHLKKLQVVFLSSFIFSPWQSLSELYSAYLA